MTAWIHAHFPHSEVALYGCSIASALIFAAIYVMRCMRRGRGFHLVDTITQAGSGSTFPIFLLMPVIPFDKDLLTGVTAGWTTFGLAGLIGVGVTLYGLFAAPIRRH